MGKRHTVFAAICFAGFLAVLCFPKLCEGG